MEINLYVLACLFFFGLFVLPFSAMIIFKNKRTVLKIIMSIFLVIYLSSIFVGTTAEITTKKTSMIIDYNFSAGWFSMSFLWAGSTITNFFINIIMMFPMGLFVFSFCKEHLVLKTILFSFILSFIIETYQFILPVARNTEILDLVLNTLSGTISAYFMLAMKKLKII